MAQIFDLLRQARAASGATADRLAATVFDLTERALGLPLESETEGADAAASALAVERDDARRAKDWARADAIRAELQADGWTVEDGPSGTVIRR